MTTGAIRFFDSVESARELPAIELVGLFVYYLTVEAGEASAKASQVIECFQECDLAPPQRTASYLSEGVKSKPPRYVKASNGGYRLQRHYREELAMRLGADRTVTQASVELRRLESAGLVGAEKAFLTETVTCFEAGASRATIIMCWILAIQHLFDHVLNHRLSDFNSALAKNPDKKLKVVKVRDDFTELSESKFIELCRAAGIVSNDVRKILEEKLGTRNSCAHPSNITVARSKAIDFVEDLVTNVVLKFPA